MDEDNTSEGGEDKKILPDESKREEYPTQNLEQYSLFVTIGTVAFNIIILAPAAFVLTALIVMSFVSGSTSSGAATILLSIPISALALTVFNGIMYAVSTGSKYRLGYKYSLIFWLAIVFILAYEIINNL